MKKNLLILYIILLYAIEPLKSQDSVTVTINYKIQNSEMISLIIGLQSDLYILGNYGILGARSADSNLLLTNYPGYNDSHLMDLVESNPANSYQLFQKTVKFPISKAGLPWHCGFLFESSPNIVDIENPAIYNEPVFSECFVNSGNVQLGQFGYFWPSSTGGQTANLIRELIVPAQDATINLCYGSCLTCEGSAPLTEGSGYVLSNKSFLDIDEDGLLSEADISIPNAPFNINGSGESIYGLTGNSGTFSALIDTGNYVVSGSSFNQFISLNPNQNISIDSTIEELFFPYEMDSTFIDISASLIANTNIAGFENTAQVIVQNYGIPSYGIELEVLVPDSLEFQYSVPQPNFIEDNLLRFYIDSLNTFEQKSFYIYSLVPPPPSLLPGDSIIWNIDVAHLPNENNTINNSLTYNLPVFASYDPNDKIMLKGSNFTPVEVNNNLTFHYQIRFQNTGNFPATFIHVRDTLDSTLNPSTIKMLSASHDYSLIIDEERYLDWYFPNIQLPDSSSDPEGSIGYIQFEISPNLPVQSGDSIQNKAFIYFDFNPPIITNNEVTYINNPSGIDFHSSSKSLSIYFDNDGNLIFSNAHNWSKMELFKTDGSLIYSGEALHLNPFVREYKGSFLIVKVTNLSGENASKIFK